MGCFPQRNRGSGPVSAGHHATAVPAEVVGVVGAAGGEVGGVGELLLAGGSLEKSLLFLPGCDELWKCSYDAKAPFYTRLPKVST